jgi:putative ABC transport system substrate-binding protein
MRFARLTALALLALALLTAPLAAEAQQAGRVYRIGYLSYSSPASNPHLIEAFRQGLRELGWVEGQNITIDSRFAEGRSDAVSDLPPSWFVSRWTSSS